MGMTANDNKTRNVKVDDSKKKSKDLKSKDEVQKTHRKDKTSRGCKPNDSDKSLDFNGSLKSEGSLTELILPDSFSRLDRQMIELEAAAAAQPVDPENPYKTRYITIDPCAQPDRSTRFSFSQKRFSTLSEKDAEWLFTPGSNEADIGSSVKADKKLAEKLRAKGLISDDDKNHNSQKSITLDISSKSPTKKSKDKSSTRKSVQKKSSKDSISNMSFNGHDSEDSIKAPIRSPSGKRSKLMKLQKDCDTQRIDSGVLKAQKPKSDKKPAKQFFELINLDPSKKKERKKYSDSQVLALLEDWPDLAKEKYEITCLKGKKVAHVYPLSMLCALGASKVTIVRCYIANPSALTEVDDGYGCPLHYACAFNGGEDLVRFLCKQDKTTITLVDAEERTPLHVAAISDAPAQVVSILAKKGPAALTMGDEDVNTPLHLACKENADFEVIHELVNKLPEAGTAMNATGATPLHLAIFNEMPHKIIETLVEANPKALKIADMKGRLPLHTAVACETATKTVTYLVEKYPEGIQIKNKHGRTPYSTAKKHGVGQDILSVLSGKGGNSVGATRGGYQV